MEKGVPIRAISRSVSVLQAINRAGSLTMMDIAHASDVPYPTACRIVQTLLYEGLIEREPARKRYRATALVQTLSHGFQGHGKLVMVARPFIVALTQKFGWPISLTTHVGHRMVVRDSTHALTSLTFNNYYPGYALPILGCASGGAYLAHVGEEERKGILGTLRRTPESQDDLTLRIWEDGFMVREIQRDGYATKGHNRHTQNPGKTSSIAVPIFDIDGVAGAISLIFFSSTMRMDDAIKKYAQDLKQTGQAISAALVESETNALAS